VGDLADPSAGLRSFTDRAEVVYNCAGELRDTTRMRLVHVDGTRRLLSEFHGRRWVQLSSVGAYGPQRSGTVTEDMPLRPRGEYESTKADADRLVEAAGKADVQYVVLRPSNVFGGGMPNQSLYQMARMIRRGLFFFVGAPGASANYIHVDNVVRALMLCALHESAAGKIYILSDWRDLESFVACVARLLACHPPRLRLPETAARTVSRIGCFVPGFPLTDARVDALTTRARYSTEKIERDLGYRNVVTMEQGLAELLAHGNVNR